MYLSAYVRDKQTGEKLVIARDDYTSKKAFEKDLRANGYAVIRVSNNRDLAAQDVGFESYAEMKREYVLLYEYNKEFWADKWEKLATIEAIEL